ncbi:MULTISPECIES: hypothetical protein [Psychrilyobacter]|nr:MULTISPECIES: hypothetical protein [Psychrilyobacter]MCS5422924.1 hypothetical protein [Psychrilyobacter sp. S5]NDI79074.1 hypothetical protein [Psychrilyobacter piezotolerans]
MNKRSESIFYTSCGHNAKLGCLEETRVKKGEIITRLKCELDSTELKLLGLGNFDEWMEDKIKKSERSSMNIYLELFNKNKKEQKNRIGNKHENKKNDEIKKWINALFFKKISEEKEHKYSHTIAISKNYFDGFKCDGIFFPSIASYGRSINLSLKPKIADNYVSPLKVQVLEILDITNEGYKLKLKKESKEIRENGEIIWSW